MKTALIRIERILRKIKSDIILNEICSGKTVYFENPVEEIAFKCIHCGIGKPSKYYAKHYGRDEYEIDLDSSYIIMAVMEGKPISKARYDHYHLIEGVFWNRDFKIPARTRQWVISG
jgi:hypothetical protein